MSKELISLYYGPEFLKRRGTFEYFFQEMSDQNFVDYGELAERVIAKKGGLTKNKRGQKGSDFGDGSDSKYVTARTYNGSTYASVAGLSHKIGTLRVWCHEPKQNKDYYFLIPHKVYAPYQSAKDSLKIWFDKEGNPRSPSRRGHHRPDLWEYECTKQEWYKAIGKIKKRK